ncbi:hypothetical protein RB653_003692 [Dictyostelium firmibasis]|uniref:Uncharacterized protein n=1 Tax=Dictyostelium firmibasis TaxID=79012 RepID=A0AAN7YRU1_9MYCE
MGRVDEQIKDNYNSISHEGERLSREAKIEADRLRQNAKLDAQDIKRDMEESAHSSWDTVKDGAKSVQDYIVSGFESVKHSITTTDPDELAIENLKENINEKIENVEKDGSTLLGEISDFFKGTAEDARIESDIIGMEAFNDGDPFVGDVHKTFHRTNDELKNEAIRLSKEAEYESNRLYDESGRIFKDVKKDSGKLFDDVKKETNKIYNDTKNEGNKFANDLKKDAEKFAEESKKVAVDIKNKANDTYQGLSHDASKKATQLKKKAGETIDESADALEHQYDLFKRDLQHLNQRSGIIYSGFGLIGGYGASKFLVPNSSPITKLSLMAGFASLGAYYGLHQPYNRTIDNAFNKANNKKEEIKKKW